MNYIEAPSDITNPGALNGCHKSIFLAGGITNCPDWQQEMRELLSDTNLTILNPRRANFPIHDKSAAYKQIKWEHKHLHLATAILFWFPEETLCPIVLYELGYWAPTTKPIFIGTHLEYARRQDVEIQTRLARPQRRTIVYQLPLLANQVIHWANNHIS